ncbi:MAG: PBP1A family penicillin-binding protein [Alphaproteobacteria bacterium]|nr:PBP1A family penicillin-binding protein [Alphaproteobacteria bacterium]
MNEPLTAGEIRPPRRRLPPPPRERRRGGVGRFFGRVLGALLGLAVLAAGVGIGAGVLAWRHFASGLPDVHGLQEYQPPVMSRIYAGDSHLLAELATERRIFVPYAAIPDLVKHAFVSAEDQKFFIHRGVDPVAMTRAAITDLMHMGQGRRPVGASTITQQVAKNMLLGNEVTLSRKVKEVILALRIEQTLSKERILELYLNEIYLGLSSYGVAAAAEAYFNKSLDALTLPEAAFLAALPKAPNNYNPFRYPEAARARRDWVIDRMVEDGVVTAAQAAAAKATPITPAPAHRLEVVSGGDYFAEEVRRQLVEKFGADVATQGGLVVRTSLDPVLQAAADRALRAGLMRYDQRRGGWRGPVTRLSPAPALHSDWATQLAAVARPPGMLPDWRLGVVLEAGDAEAKLGVFGAGEPPRVLPMQLADITWARPAQNGSLGATPKRVTDVVHPGDVVMVERVAAEPASGRTAARPERLLLRQIPQVEGALVSLDPATGRVLALCGGWSFDMSQFDRATQANRQPGSSFKPFVYLTALEQGISPSQRFLDAPFVVDLGAQGKWRPGNYEGDFLGPVSLHVALERSRNLVTVRLANRLGMQSVADTAIAFHMVDSMPKVLPAALGAVETTVLREAGAYAGLAEGGKAVVPTLIDTVQDRDGHVVWHPSELRCDACDDPSKPPELVDNRPRVADPASVFQLNLMMQGVVQRGTGTAAGAGLNRQIAGKTGTSQDFQDAWFAGFTPDLVTVVWVGFDTPASLGNNETGGAVAAPIWHDFMAVALKNRPVLTFPAPPGVTVATWDSNFGPVTDAFKPGQEPGASAPLGGGVPSAAANAAAPQAAAPGVDSSMPGLY